MMAETCSCRKSIVMLELYMYRDTGTEQSSLHTIRRSHITFLHATVVTDRSNSAAALLTPLLP
jgi:hypothetical protein